MNISTALRINVPITSKYLDNNINNALVLHQALNRLVFETRDKQLGDDETYTLRDRPTPSANVAWTAEKIDVSTLRRLKIAAQADSPRTIAFRLRFIVGD